MIVSIINRNNQDNINYDDLLTEWFKAREDSDSDDQSSDNDSDDDDVTKYNQEVFFYAGSYSNSQVNMFTNKRECPIGSLPFEWIYDLTMCYAQTDDVGKFQFDVDFGGFYSCQGDNIDLLKPKSHSLRRKGDCSGLFTEVHLIKLASEGCNIYYCISNVARKKYLEKNGAVDLPPYIEWTDLMKKYGPPVIQDNESCSGLDNKDIAVLIILTNVLFIGLLVGLLYLCSRSPKRNTVEESTDHHW